MQSRRLLGCTARAMRPASWTGSWRWIPRWCGPTNTPPGRATTTRGPALSDTTRQAQSRHDQALGRSRGGLSTKVHLAVDGHLRPLSLHLTGGQAGEAAP
jgi:hypothetical protein